MKFLNSLKFFLFLLLCLLFFAILFKTNQFLSVKKIELVSDKKFILANENELINRNLALINQEEVSKKILKENSLLKTVIVKKVWPSTLRVTVYFYEPNASLKVNRGFFNLSVDGRILTKTKENLLSLPVINYYQLLNSNSFQIGDWLDFKDIKQTLFFVDKLNQINLKPLTIDISGQDMLVFKLTEGIKIVFSINKDKEEQYYLLKTVVRQFNIQGKKFKGIDLRFNKPVIEL